MEVERSRSFTRDFSGIPSSEMRGRVLRKIEELEAAPTLTEVSGVRRITSEGDHDRIRIGEYRLGIVVESNVVILLRFLHRRDIYRFFP